MKPKTEPTHTPGPWWVDHRDAQEKRLDQPRTVAITAEHAIVTNAPGSIHDRPHEWLANANLLAASPDLLAALERLPQWCADRGFSMLLDPGEVPPFMARALAKARGRS